MKKQFLALAMAASALAACSNDDENILGNDNILLDNPVAVNFKAGVASRVSNNQWEANDQIGILVEGKDEYTNVAYQATSTGASTTFEAVDAENIIYFTSKNESLTFYTYYPYTETLNDDGTITVNTLEKNADILWATGTAAYDGTNEPTVNFTYQHKMAQFNINLTSDANNSINGQSIVLSGLKHQGTLDLKTGNVTATTDATTADWNLGTPSADTWNYTGLIIPQNASDLTLKVGDKTVQLPAIEKGKLEAGKKYTMDVKATGEKLEVELTIGGSTIEGWVDASSSDKTKIAFISTAASTDAFDGESKAAYEWLVGTNKYDVTYIPTSTTNADLSSYEMIWSHIDWESTDAAINDAVKSYYTDGGKVLVSREAMKNLVAWGIAAENNGINWTFGDNGDSNKEEVTFDQSLVITASDHALFTGLADNNLIHKSGYSATRKMRGWGETFSVDDLSTWSTANGTTRLARDGGKENSVTIAEFTKDNGACAIAIGDPCFEWAGSTEENTHLDNLHKLTQNAIDYLISK